MAIAKFEIHVIVDFDEPDKIEIARNLCRKEAKLLLTQMMLLQDRRPPQVILQAGDMFEATKEIMLVEGDVIDEETTEEAPTEGARTQEAEIARVAGYTVSDKGSGWKFNDPNGKWSDSGYKTEAEAWAAAYADRNPAR